MAVVVCTPRSLDEQRGFKFFEGGFVDGAGEGGDVGDFGGEGLAGAGDGLPHAVEEVFFWFFGPGFSGSSLPKRVLIIFFSLIGECGASGVSEAEPASDWATS